MICPRCEQNTPSDGKFCVYCGAQLNPETPVVTAAPVTGPTQRLESTPSYNMPAPASAPAPVAAISTAYVQRRHNKEAIGAVWLIGMGVLLLTGEVFPGVLVLIGLTAYLSQSAHGRNDKAMQSLLFFAGLAVLFWANFIFPGILFLLGAMMFFNRRGHWKC